MQRWVALEIVVVDAVLRFERYAVIDYGNSSWPFCPILGQVAPHERGQGRQTNSARGAGWWRAIYTRRCPSCQRQFESLHEVQLTCSRDWCAVQRRWEQTRERVRRHRQRRFDQG